MPTRPLLLTLAVLSGPPGADQPDPAEVQRVYDQAQEQVQNMDYLLAVGSFETLIEMFPEVEENRMIRETLILNLLNVTRQAYQRLLNDDGSRKSELVERGLGQLARYEAAYEDTYGNRPSSAELDAAEQKLRDALAVGEPRTEPCLSPLPPCLSPPPIAPRRGCGGDNGGVASLMLLPFALRRRRKSVLDQVAGALPADVVARLRRRLDSDV
ncbi:MAG: hypothetical protein ACRBN8_13265 [Nannocystales bacterium]